MSDWHHVSLLCAFWALSKMVWDWLWIDNIFVSSRSFSAIGNINSPAKPVTVKKFQRANYSRMPFPARNARGRFTQPYSIAQISSKIDRLLQGAGADGDQLFPSEPNVSQNGTPHGRAGWPKKGIRGREIYFPKNVKRARSRPDRFSTLKLYWRPAAGFYKTWMVGRIIHYLHIPTWAEPNVRYRTARVWIVTPRYQYPFLKKQARNNTLYASRVGSVEISQSFYRSAF